MSLRSLQQGIEAVQKGNHDEGARLLQIALRDTEMPGNLRATGWMWLAATNPDIQFRINCYRQAYHADPTNKQASDGLSALLGAPLSTTALIPEPIRPAKPAHLPGTASLGTAPLPNNPPLHSGDTPTAPYPAAQPAPQAAPGTMYYGQTAAPVPETTPPYGQPPVPPPQSPRSTQTMPGVQPGIPYPPGTGYPPEPGSTTGTMPAVSLQQLVIQGAQRSVGILGGPNGRGTGFFVTQDGLIATTRYVVGGLEDVEVELLNQQRLPGKVVHAYPDYDLALIQVNATVTQLMPVSHNPIIPDNTPLLIISHAGEVQRTSRRETRQEMPMYWFPTLEKQLHDAGGSPVFDNMQFLVGMMTRNASRNSGFLYGVHITLIYKCVDQHTYETQQLNGRGVYCNHCGNLSRAGAFNAFYCERCGATLPPALAVDRYPQPNMGALYGENMNRPCPHCRSTVGYYQGTCLRCGRDVSSNRPT